MRLTFTERIGALRLRRYQHPRHGIVETLTQQSVVFVRPVFGLLKPDKQPPPEVAKFRTQKPAKPKRARNVIGNMLKRTRSAGGDA